MSREILRNLCSNTILTIPGVRNQDYPEISWDFSPRILEKFSGNLVISWFIFASLQDYLEHAKVFSSSNELKFSKAVKGLNTHKIEAINRYPCIVEQAKEQSGQTVSNYQDELKAKLKLKRNCSEGINYLLLKLFSIDELITSSVMGKRSTKKSQGSSKERASIKNGFYHDGKTAPSYIHLGGISIQQGPGA
uniref:Uncharacterized protein n=1 Tax=Magallana gigas TaxID=29159 RepID=K1PPK7_MAGGI